MSTHSLSRRIMVVMIAATVALGGIALPAAAKGGKGRGDQQVQTATAKGKGKARSAEAKQRAPKFVVSGFATAVDASTVTVQIKGGNKSLRKLGTPVSFTVAEGARVKLNGERVELTALAAGDRVVVKGAKLGDVLTAYKVFASREEQEDDSDSDDSQEETEDVTTGDDSSGTGDDTTTGDDSTTSDDTPTSDGDVVTP